MELSDYQVKTDTNIGHDSDWEDIKKCVQIIKACLFDKEDIDWTKLGIKIGVNKRPNNHKGDEIEITLPDAGFIKNNENDTTGYLVLISAQMKNGFEVIMPRYFDYIFNKIMEQRKNKG